MRGTLLLDEPMSSHTSWRAGGNAERYYVPADLEDLSLFLAGLDDTEELHWLGLGSNMLVRDGGLKGTVIATAGVLGELTLHEGGLKVGAGTACAKVARFSARHSLAGAEFLAGIPGTIGGALAMNAGAFGGEMWDIVTSVETINRKGEILFRLPQDFETSYRSVITPANEFFVSAALGLDDDPGKLGLNNIRELLDQRAETQPIGEHSCGSVFRNPPGDYAARLIEACGLKGKVIGGARVSDKHANFIINSDKASAGEIEQLITLVQQAVLEKFKVRLETEVRIVGDPV